MSRGGRAETERVLCLVADPVAEAVIRKLSPGAISLHSHYGEGVPRSQSVAAVEKHKQPPRYDRSDRLDQR
jgi:hypothetical protein